MSLTSDDDMQANEYRDPVEPRKCVRHRWQLVIGLIEGSTKEAGRVTLCKVCGKPKDEALSRRSNNNRKRGNRIQRERIVALGGRNLAGNNPGWDGTSELFSFESKSGTFFSEKHWRILRAIPAQGQQSRVLIVTDAPGPGHRARSYVVVEFDEWKALHGEVVK